MNTGCKGRQRIHDLLGIVLVIWSTNTCSAQTTILTQPQNEAVAIGSTAAFTVVTDGTPPLSYQWEFMGTNLDGATQAILLITNVQPSQSGLYSVTVSNSQAVVTSSSALLSVVGIQGWGLSGPGLTNIPAGLINIPTGLTNILAISVLHDHCLALTDNGQVFAWGDNSYDLMNVPGDLTNAVAICAGDEHYLALRADGSITVWGYWSSVPGNLGKVIGIAAGDSRVSFALKADGTVIGWGLFNTNVPSDLTNVVRIVSGGNQHLALKVDGTVVSWGPNNYGQLNPPADLTNAVAIAAAEQESMALRADGSVVVWGTDTIDVRII